MSWKTMLEGRDREEVKMADLNRFSLASILLITMKSRRRGEDIPIQYKIHSNLILEVGHLSIVKRDVRNEDRAGVD